MPDFKSAVDYVIDNEGRTYTNNPNDKGGPTKFGITQHTLAQWRKKPVSPKDVESLTQDEAEQIYEAFYWLPMGCDKLSDQRVATAIFDTGVPMGPVMSVKYAQAVVAATQDGHMGESTEALLNKIEGRLFLSKFIPKVQDRYIAIVKANHSQIEFLDGWLNRSQRLISLMV